MARGRRGSGPYTKDAAQVGVRLEDDLNRTLGELAAREGVERPEMARRLMRRGIAAVAAVPERLRPELTREQAAERGAFAMDLLSDLLVRFESTDPVGAVVLARGVERAARDWADDRAATHGIGLSADDRVAQLVDSLVVLVRAAPEAERLPLWQAVLGTVTAQSREDYAALTGDKQDA